MHNSVLGIGWIINCENFKIFLKICLCVTRSWSEKHETAERDDRSGGSVAGYVEAFGHHSSADHWKCTFRVGFKGFRCPERTPR